MFTKRGENQIHLLIFSFTIDCLLLIIFLFFNPIFDYLIEALEWFKSELEAESNIIWWIIIFVVIIIALPLVHEAWQGICLFSFLSQISSAVRLFQECNTQQKYVKNLFLFVNFNFLFYLVLKITLEWLTNIFQPIKLLDMLINFLGLTQNLESTFSKYLELQ